MILTGPMLMTAAAYTELGRDRCHSDVIAVFDGLRVQMLVGNAPF